AAPHPAGNGDVSGDRPFALGFKTPYGAFAGSRRHRYRDPSVRGHGGAHFGAHAENAAELEAPADQPDPLAHLDEAQSAAASQPGFGRGDVESIAVVLDHRRPAPVVKGQHHLAMPGPAVG